MNDCLGVTRVFAILGGLPWTDPIFGISYSVSKIRSFVFLRNFWEPVLAAWSQAHGGNVGGGEVFWRYCLCAVVLMLQELLPFLKVFDEQTRSLGYYRVFFILSNFFDTRWYIRFGFSHGQVEAPTKKTRC